MLVGSDQFSRLDNFLYYTDGVIVHVTMYSILYYVHIHFDLLLTPENTLFRKLIHNFNTCSSVPFNCRKMCGQQIDNIAAVQSSNTSCYFKYQTLCKHFRDVMVGTVLVSLIISVK